MKFWHTFNKSNQSVFGKVYATLILTHQFEVFDMSRPIMLTHVPDLAIKDSHPLVGMHDLCILTQYFTTTYISILLDEYSAKYRYY